MAAASIASVGSSKNPKLKAVRDVEIDKSGTYKYILLKIHDPDKDREFKHVVRGSSKAAYHADIYDDIVTNIEARGLDVEIVGGGRIHHEPSKKHMKIYGYSQGYGRADHSITQAIIQRKYGSEWDIKWSNDGY